MKKTLLLFAALTLSVGLWAQTQSVTYIDENGVEQTVDATVVTNEDTPVTWGTAGTTSWYVVNMDYYSPWVELSQGAVCAGDVRLILADAACLIATAVNSNYTPGIQVSGEGNSLTIYGQFYQDGRLEANGGMYAAGIGGGYYQSGNNITINGGTVIAHGGERAAGIGGGENGSGSNITINGGRITAHGGERAAGIGCDLFGSSSNITVVTTHFVKAGNEENPTTEIATTRTSTTDIASDLAGNRYVEIEQDPYLDIKTAAIAEIDAAIEGVTDADIIAIATAAKTNIILARTIDAINSIKARALADIDIAKAVAEIEAAIDESDNDNVKAVATHAVTAINAAETFADVNTIKTFALAAIASARAAYFAGKEETQGEMGEPCEDCPAVEVSDDNTTIILYNPKNVTFRKTNEANK